MSLDGQIVSPLPDGGLAVSCSRIVEDGSRVGLILVEDLFRFDVQPTEDTLRAVVRDLSGGECEWRQRECEQPGAYAFDIRVDGRDAEVQVLASRTLDGGWALTAQARLHAA